MNQRDGWHGRMLTYTVKVVIITQFSKCVQKAEERLLALRIRKFAFAFWSGRTSTNGSEVVGIGSDVR